MTHREKYRNKTYILRKKYADNLYFEIIDVRIRNGRIECLSRWNKHNSDVTFGYRWRKVCGKDIIIPYLNRPAKDDHNWSLTIRNTFNGKMSRVYLRDFEVV